MYYVNDSSSLIFDILKYGFYLAVIVGLVILVAEKLRPVFYILFVGIGVPLMLFWEGVKGILRMLGFPIKENKPRKTPVKKGSLPYADRRSTGTVRGNGSPKVESFEKSGTRKKEPSVLTLEKRYSYPEENVIQILENLKKKVSNQLIQELINSDIKSMKLRAECNGYIENILEEYKGKTRAFSWITLKMGGGYLTIDQLVLSRNTLYAVIGTKEIYSKEQLNHIASKIGELFGSDNDLEAQCLLFSPELSDENRETLEKLLKKIDNSAPNSSTISSIKNILERSKISLANVYFDKYDISGSDFK